MTCLLISSGNGPGECQQATGHVLARMKEEAVDLGVTLDLVCRGGRNGPVSAVAVLSGARADDLAARWTGSLLWRCPSALRPRHKRKTWFVQVFRLPDAARGAAIDPRAVEMVAIRAGGPGGQHQNKTSSAIRARWGSMPLSSAPNAHNTRTGVWHLPACRPWPMPTRQRRRPHGTDRRIGCTIRSSAVIRCGCLTVRVLSKGGRGNRGAFGVLRCLNTREGGAKGRRGALG